jgi:hypothetical protein
MVTHWHMFLLELIILLFIPLKMVVSYQEGLVRQKFENKEKQIT